MPCRPNAALTRIFPVFALLVTALTSAAAPAADNSYPLTLTKGSRLMISARINGHPVQALLDSAAEMTLIDPDFARALKLSAGTSVTGQGSGAENFEAKMVEGV